jgi:hypothetical protein
MAENERPDARKSQYIEGWQQQERKREQQREEEQRTHRRYTIAILVGFPLLAILFCCGILSWKSPQSTTFHAKD